MQHIDEDKMEALRFEKEQMQAKIKAMKNKQGGKKGKRATLTAEQRQARQRRAKAMRTKR